MHFSQMIGRLYKTIPTSLLIALGLKSSQTDAWSCGATAGSGSRQVSGGGLETAGEVVEHTVPECRIVQIGWVSPARHHHHRRAADLREHAHRRLAEPVVLRTVNDGRRHLKPHIISLPVPVLIGDDSFRVITDNEARFMTVSFTKVRPW